MQKRQNNTLTGGQYASGDDTKLITTGYELNNTIETASSNASFLDVLKDENSAHSPVQAGVNFWVVWSLVFASSVLIVVICFYKYYDEPDTVIRHVEPERRNLPFKATDNYPGPPKVNGKIMGSVRCPSYSRAVKGLQNADRSPPPDYKSNRNDMFILDSVRSVITDSFASWFSMGGPLSNTGIDDALSDVLCHDGSPGRLHSDVNQIGQDLNGNGNGNQKTYRIV